MTTKSKILDRLDKLTNKSDSSAVKIETEFEWLASTDVRSSVKRDGTIALYLNAVFRCLMSSSFYKRKDAVTILRSELLELSNESRPLILFRILSWGTHVSDLDTDLTSTFNQIVLGYRDNKELCLDIDLLAFSSPCSFFIEVWRRYGVSRNESQLFRDMMTRYDRLGHHRQSSHIMTALNSFLREEIMNSRTKNTVKLQRQGKKLVENLDFMMSSSSMSYIWQHRALDHVVKFLTLHTAGESDVGFLAFTLPLLEVCCTRNIYIVSANDELVEKIRIRYESGANRRRQLVLRGELPKPEDLSTNPEMLYRLRSVLSLVIQSYDPIKQHQNDSSSGSHFENLMKLIESSLDDVDDDDDDYHTNSIVEKIAASTTSLCEMTLHCALMIPAISTIEVDRLLRKILPSVAKIQNVSMSSENVLIRSLLLLFTAKHNTSSRSSIERVLGAYVRHITWKSSLCSSKSSLAKYVVHVSASSRELPDRALSALLLDIVKRYSTMKDDGVINDNVRIANAVLNSPRDFLPQNVAHAVTTMMISS